MRHMMPTRLLLLSLLIMLSPSVFALGLGNVKVESYLNQPLSARIDLLVRPGEDISGVTARLASAEDYALIGASRDAISVPLRFTVDTQTDQPFVRVTSNLPINQPIVRLIIELNWASGRLLREYTLFLDPPTVAAAAPPPIIDQRRESAPSPAQPLVQAEESLPPSSDSEISDGDSASTTASGSASATDGLLSGEDEFGPVQGGDTLWRIASNWSAGLDASVNQVMLAIQRNNPQAFINNNINLLKRGAILRMPSTADIEAITAEAARNEVLEQSQLFASKLANQVPAPNPQTPTRAVETPLVDVASEMSSSTPSDSSFNDGAQLEIIPPSEESAADSAYGAEDSVETSSASTSVAALQEELARKEEALITEQQTNEYLQQRIQELESRLDGSDAPGLLVEDGALADMESRLREQRLSPDTVEEPVQQNIVATTNAPPVAPLAAPDQPWYSRWTTWLIGLLVLLAAGFGWFRSRRSGEEFEVAATVSNGDTVRGIKDDAEEILKVLEPEMVAGAVDSEPVVDKQDDGPGAGITAEAEQESSSRFSQARYLDHEEAHVLDEDSADPEVRLDLARAYISMGDREAARAILGEVVEHGNEAQKTEAKAMLGGL